MKKRIITFLLAFLFLGGISMTTSSCNKDAHCPAYKTLHSKSTKKGLSTKKGNSRLFPKGMK